MFHSLAPHGDHRGKVTLSSSLLEKTWKAHISFQDESTLLLKRMLTYMQLYPDDNDSASWPTLSGVLPRPNLDKVKNLPSLGWYLAVYH